MRGLTSFVVIFFGQAVERKLLGKIFVSLKMKEVWAFVTTKHRTQLCSLRCFGIFIPGRILYGFDGFMLTTFVILAYGIKHKYVMMLRCLKNFLAYETCSFITAVPPMQPLFLLAHGFLITSFVFLMLIIGSEAVVSVNLG